MDSRYILEQAAQILDVSVPQLLLVGQLQTPPSVIEQAAVTSDVPPRPFVQHGLQSPENETHYPSGAGDLRPYPALHATPQPAVSLLGLSGSGIADCPSSFTAYGPHANDKSQDGEYQAISTAVPFEFLVAVDAAPATATLPTIQALDHVFASPTAEPPSLLGCDETTLLGSYMPQYPTLPPSRPVAVEQTPVTREATCYPDDAAGVPYSQSLPTNCHIAQVVTAQPVLQVVDHLAQYIPSPVTTGTPSSSSSNMAVVGELAPRYGFDGYGCSSGAVGESATITLQVYGRALELDMVFPIQRAPPAKRGPFKDDAERQKTAYTRKIGSCIRCRMQRIRCHTDPDDEKGPCGTCKKVANTDKVWRLPCLRLKINDVILSKPGPVKGYEWTRRWKDGMVTEDISNWASNEIRTIRVTEGFTSQPVVLQVRQFVPQEGDSLERSWFVDGVKRTVKTPPFALVDMDAAKASYNLYIKNGLEECCKRLVGADKKLMWRTYAQAMDMVRNSSMDRKERQLLLNTLELWMSIRLTTTSFEIVGDETLGMTRDIMDETSPLSGKIPLPPVMGAQLDSILIHQIQAKLRHDTLELLQRLTQENKQKSWLTIYLVTFVLLHNIALVIKHDASYARKHGIERRFAREDKVKEYYVGAVTLLAYFHYRGGSRVFAPDFKDEDLRTHSGDEAVQFVRDIRRHAKKHERHWRDILDNGEVENDYYLVAQMYEQNWMPRSWPA